MSLTASSGGSSGDGERGIVSGAEEARRECSTVGCPLTARLGHSTCCDYCPVAHVNECLLRHSEDERRQARRHVASCRATEQAPAPTAGAVTAGPYENPQGKGRASASDERKPKPKPASASEAAGRAATREADELEDVSRQLAAFTAPSADDAVL